MELPSDLFLIASLQIENVSNGLTMNSTNSKLFLLSIEYFIKKESENP